MKLASLKDGRDGQLIVVSRDLSKAVDASDIAQTLQAALDEWDLAAPQLAARYELLNAGQGDSFAFDQSACASPLPRAYQWLDGSAYLNHVELVRKARGAVVPWRFGGNSTRGARFVWTAAADNQLTLVGWQYTS